MSSSTTPTSGRLLRLAPADNVAVATANLPAGAVLPLGNRSVTLVEAIPLGYKVAVTAIAAGAKVVKYGCPIGSAVCDIPCGALVHTHNLKSDYLPTRDRS